MGFAEKVNGFGGSASLARATATYTTPTLAVLAEDSSSSIVMSKCSLLLKIVTDKPARVRLYANVADQLADLTRLSDIEVTAGDGVILEVITSSSLLSIDLSPAPVADSLASTPGSAIPISVQNLSGGTGTVTTTITYIPLEN